MGLFSKLFNKNSNSTDSNQNFKHNVFDGEISQYSTLPRFYYIEGRKFDIDSPESVYSIPLCHTDFIINQEHWGIDAILREHVNRHYYKIPENLKSACYSKISDFEYTPYKTESVKEKDARLKQEREQSQKLEKLRSITCSDMEQFKINQFEMTDIFCDNNMAIMLIQEKNQPQVLKDISKMNSYIQEAINLAHIKTSISIPINDISFSVEDITIKSDMYRRYYSYFECVPYTKTGKLSKFPLILHYATSNYEDFDAENKFFGKIYYSQMGSIGKAELINWLGHNCYVFYFATKGNSLILKSIEKNKNIIYKQT